MNLNPTSSQNQKFTIQELVAATNLQAELIKRALTGLGGFQIFSEGLTEYVSGSFTAPKLIEIIQAEGVPNNAMTAVQILNGIASSRGLSIEQVAIAFSQAQQVKLESQGVVGGIDTSRLSDRLAQHAGEIDQLLVRADYQRTVAWADRAATLSAVAQVDEFLGAKHRVANSPAFQDYVEEVFGVLAQGRLDAMGKMGNDGKMQIPVMQDYLKTPVMTAVPQSQSPALAASNPNPNLRQLASTSTSSTSSLESDGSKSNSLPTQKSAQGFGK